MGKQIKFSKEDKTEIVRLYVQEQFSVRKIGEKYNCSEAPIRRVLKLQNIITRSLSESHRKTPINENYFENIDSKDKAYLLGFLYADGHITKYDSSQNVMGISQCEIEPLQHFQKYIGNCKIGQYIAKSGYKKKDGTESIVYRYFAHSNKLVSDLEKHGCVQNKSLILKFPPLRADLISHFIRGYFDGDGSVFIRRDCRSKNIREYLGIHICGTKEFLEVLGEHISLKDQVYKELRTTTNC